MSKLLKTSRFRWGFASILTMSMVAIIVVLMALVTFVDIGRERGNSRDDQEEQGSLMIGGLDDILANYLYLGDVDALRNIAARVVHSQPDIEYVQILGPSGGLLAASTDEIGHGDYPSSLVAEQFGVGETQSGRTATRFVGDRLEMARPISLGTDFLGVIQVGFNSDALGSEIKSIIFQHIWQGLILIAIGVVLSYFVARYASKPLRELAAAAREIGEGNLEASIPSSGTVETADLGRSLDIMRAELLGTYQNLEQRVSARTEELAAMFEVASILARPGSFEEKIASVMEELARTADGELAIFRMPDDRQEGLRRVGGAGPGNLEASGPPVILYGDNLPTIAYREERAVIVNDYVTHHLATPHGIERGVKSLLSVPIKADGATLGVVSISALEHNHFTPDRVRLLTAIIDGLGTLLVNSKLAQSLESSREEMAVVDEVARVITSTLDIAEVYEQFASEVKMLMDVDQLRIGMIDESRNILNLSYVALNPGVSLDRRESVPLQGTISGHVAKTRETIIIDDLSQETRFWSAQQLVEDGLRSTIAVPLFSKDKLVGTLFVLSAEANAYGGREQVIVERLAAQIAPSIDNSLLFQQMEQLSLALESIGEGVAFLDREEKFKYMNRAFLQLYGYNAEELLDKSGAIIVPADEENQAAAKRAWAEGNVSGWRGEVKRVRKDGQVIDVLITLTPLKNKDGEIIGRIGVARDITERKQAEERLQETARLSSIGELAAGVAHEINNPLTSVLGFSQLLLLEDVPPAFREDLETVHSEAERAAKVVQNLLSFARRPEPTKTYLDITSVLARSLDMKSYDFQVENIQVIRDFAVDLPLTMADEQQLIQVFLNVINNAEQAMSRHNGRGQLTVRTTTSGISIKVSIKDDGPGIAAEIVPRIFEPFFTTKAVGDGTGLGLSVSYGIVTQHGGEIWADSSPGGGTTFYVELPITGEEAVESPQPASVPIQISDTKRVLVVDDEPSIRELLSRTLTVDGLAVDLAADGDEALRSLHTGTYDCIILDLKMPGMSGQQLYRAIGDLGGELTEKVIFITGDTVSPDTLNFINRAGNLSLTKPLDLDALRKSVRNSFEPAGWSA